MFHTGVIILVLCFVIASLQIRAFATPFESQFVSSTSTTADEFASEVQALYDLYNATNGDLWSWHNDINVTSVDYDLDVRLTTTTSSSELMTTTRF